MKFKVKKNDPTQVAIILENEKEITTLFCLFNFRPITENNDVFTFIYNKLNKHREDHYKDLPNLKNYLDEFTQITSSIKEEIK